MSDDIEAAAERYRDSLEAFMSRDMEPYELVQHHMDERKLARAYIARLAADRSERVNIVPTRDAINLLGKAAERLPEGWEIELRFSRDEASLSLIDPQTGSDVDDYFGDYECSFLGAIESAVEQAEKDGDA